MDFPQQLFTYLFIVSGIRCAWPVLSFEEKRGVVCGLGQGRVWSQLKAVWRLFQLLERVVRCQPLDRVRIQQTLHAKLVMFAFIRAFLVLVL